MFSERGGYPLAHLRADAPWEQLADQLNETVIKRVIQHDLRLGERGRKRDPALLEELFRLCCRYAGQAPTIQTLGREAQRVLQANVGSQRINAYLRFLGDTLLLRLIPPLEIRLKRKKGSPKLCLVDHGLRASWLQEQIPLDPARLREEPELTVLAGHLAESATGALLATVGGLDIAHFPERHGEPEVDFVLTVGIKRIPVEVNYQARLDPMRDTEGLRSFIEKAINNAPFGLLITQDDSPGIFDPRIVALPLSSLMLLR
jgi:predicted AAA+ superfamily ATPase